MYREVSNDVGITCPHPEIDVVRCFRDVPCIIPKEQYVRKKGPTKSPGPEGAAAGQKRTNGATEGEEADEDGTAAPKAKRRRKAADSSAAMSSAEGIVEEHEVDEAGIVYGQHTYHYWPGVAPGYPPLSFENGLPEGMAAAGHPALEGLGDIQAAQLQLSGPAPNAETQADMSAFNVVHLPDEPTVGMVILPPNVPLPFLGMGGDAAKRFELNIDSLRGTDLGASIFGIKPSFPKSSCVAPMTPPSPRKALVDPFPTPSTLGSGHSVIPRPLSPITLRCPLSDACAAAHISHFLRYNYPVINVVHPEYMLERIAQRTCEPALFWSALGIASLACSHCPECREGMVKRAVMQRSSLELHSAVRSALSRPWRTREEWYGRVQLVTALFVQTATAFSVKNLVASVKLRIPAAILLTDRTGIGICADLTPPWTISTGKEWIEWEEALRAFWIPRNLGP